METDEVIGCFYPDPQIDAERDRVMAWRNWRVSLMEIIKERMDEMQDEEEWALNQLDTNDIIHALNPFFIKSIHIKKRTQCLEKIKEKVVEQGLSVKEVIEAEFRKNLKETLKHFIVETYQPQGGIIHRSRGDI